MYAGIFNSWVLLFSKSFHVTWTVPSQGLVNGLLTAGKTLLSTSVLLLVSLFIFSCIAVELIAKDSDTSWKRKSLQGYDGHDSYRPWINKPLGYLIGGYHLSIILSLFGEHPLVDKLRFINPGLTLCGKATAFTELYCAGRVSCQCSINSSNCSEATWVANFCCSDFAALYRDFSDSLCVQLLYTCLFSSLSASKACMVQIFCVFL